MMRLDYLSCFLTILSTVLVGKKLWQAGSLLEQTASSSVSSECERRNSDLDASAHDTVEFLVLCFFLLLGPNDIGR